MPEHLHQARQARGSALVLPLVTMALILALWSVCPPRRPLKAAPFLEGVYVTAQEIGGFSGTILELRKGEYRCWFYSDVGSNSHSMPQRGRYSISNAQVKLDNGRTWTIGNTRDLAMLWRTDSLRAWKEDGQIYDYGILVRVDGPVPEYAWGVGRPSIEVVFAALGRPHSRWKDPFVYGPQ